MVHQGPIVVRLSNQVLTGLPGLYTIMEVLTKQCSVTEIAADRAEMVPLNFMKYDVMSVASKIPGAAGALGAEAIDPRN